MDFSGILFYGIPLRQSDSDEERSERIEKYELARRKREMPRPSEDDYDSPKWKEWRVALRKWEADQVSRGFCGHSEYQSSEFLFIEGSRITADWDEFKEIASLAASPAWREKIRQYCEALDLPFEEPKWYLTAHFSH